MHNLYLEFLSLLPARPLLVGDVSATDGDIALVDLPGGGQLQARGSATIGQRVFVRDGQIEGEAPTLTYVAADV